MRPQSEAPAKKPYQQPKLFVYGNLTEMTQTKPVSFGTRDPSKNLPLRKTGP